MGDLERSPAGSGDALYVACWLGVLAQLDDRVFLGRPHLASVMGAVVGGVARSLQMISLGEQLRFFLVVPPA